jgi:ABC-2 type transport system permease protein
MTRARPGGAVLANAGLANPGLAGTGQLTRLALRRDRIALVATVYVIVAAVAGTAYTFKKLYPTAAGRAALATTGEGNPALRFLYGRLDGDSIGSLTSWRYGIWAGIFAALVAIFVVIRHTRTDEEAGRLELVGSAVVGRDAPLVAALITAIAPIGAVTVLLWVALPFIGLPAAGSAALALGIGACGLAFTGIAAVAAQLTSGARAARGIALAGLGLAFVLRGVGDAAGAAGGLSWLSWASPLAWIQLARPFAAERWWVLLLPLATFALGVVLAFVLAARRDLGAGLLPDRPGRATASRLLSGPSGLAWRLQRGALAGWVTGYAFTFAASGAAAQGIGQLFGTSSALQREFSRIGGQSAIVNAYLAALMLLAGLVAAAYATSAVLRLRSEETDGRAEPVLATRTGRIRWALSHIVVAVAGTALLLAVAGVAAGLGYGLRAGSPGPEVTRMLGAAFAQLPASLALAAVAVLLFGLAPRAAVPGAWTAVGLVVAIALFGQVLQVSHWVLDISPFTQTPRLPGGTVTAEPLLWLCLAALAFGVTGLFGLRRRDIG